MTIHARSFRFCLLLGAAFAVTVAALVACGDDNPPATGGTVVATQEDASVGPGPSSGGDGADAAPGDEPVQCVGPELGGSVVLAIMNPGVPPTDTGGTIAPGTYDLTALDLYAGLGEEGDPDGGTEPSEIETARGTLVITDTDMRATRSRALDGGVTNATAFVARQHTSDVFLFTDESCPTTDTRQTPFSATGTSLALHTGQTRRETYTRRP